MIYRYSIGIDEVGRGPIAGPVAVGAFVFLDNSARSFFKGVKESKQLNEEKREEWFVKICQTQEKGLVDFYVSFQNEKVIDEKGLSFAIKKCLENSLNKIYKNIIKNGKSEIDFKNVQVLLDGGLKAPVEYKNQKTIIKGDEKETVIAMASICAKVLRDRKMKKLAKKYPEYGFDIHKGYGTKGHYEAISRQGLCTLHRTSFLRKRGI